MFQKPGGPSQSANIMCTLIALYFHPYLVRSLRAREKAQEVGALLALAEGCSVAPNTHNRRLIPSSRASSTLFSLLWLHCAGFYEGQACVAQLLTE